MRRRLAALCLALIVASSVEYRLLRILIIDRDTLREAFVALPDNGWFPDYPAFLRGAAAHTAPGDSIALIVPSTKWNDGYAYAYYRASYFLAGRVVLPIVTEQDAIVRDNYERARYAAFWHVTPPQDARVIWSGAGGVVVARR